MGVRWVILIVPLLRASKDKFPYVYNNGEVLYREEQGLNLSDKIEAHLKLLQSREAKCIVCKKHATMDSPGDLCNTHWHQWFNYKLVVYKRLGKQIWYRLRGKRG